MTITIDAMKELQQIMVAVLRDPQNITRKMLDEMTRLIDAVIAREEAQTVEPVAEVRYDANQFKYIHFFAPHWSHVLSAGDQLAKLSRNEAACWYASEPGRVCNKCGKIHTTPQPSAAPAVKQPLSTEREALIKYVRGHAREFGDAKMHMVADMLAADGDNLRIKQAAIDAVWLVLTERGHAPNGVDSPGAMLRKMLAADAQEPDLTKPPCGECGAMTATEAETMCICAGDKDDCQGTSLWPDVEPAQQVAVPQGWVDAVNIARKLFSGERMTLTATGLGMLAEAIMDMDAIVAAAPQPPQGDKHGN